MIKAERTKNGNGAIGYRRKLPSVAITLPRDIFKASLMALIKTSMSNLSFASAPCTTLTRKCSRVQNTSLVQACSQQDRNLMHRMFYLGPSGFNICH